MGKRVRCPCCGLLVWPSQIKKSYNIDVKDMVSLGRGNGFGYTDTQDLSLVTLVKSKIKALYTRFFEVEAVIVKAVPSIIVRTGQYAPAPPILTKPNVLILPVVRS